MPSNITASRFYSENIDPLHPGSLGGHRRDGGGGERGRHKEEEEEEAEAAVVSARLQRCLWEAFEIVM